MSFDLQKLKKILPHSASLTLLVFFFVVPLQAEDSSHPQADLSEFMLKADPITEAQQQKAYMSKVFNDEQLSIIRNTPKGAPSHILRQKENEFMAKVFGLEEDSPEFKQMMNGKMGWGWKNRKKNQKVLKVIHGEKGVSFPTKEEIEKKHQIPEELKLEMMAKYRAWQDMMEEKKKVYKKKRKTLAICPRSQTTVEPIKAAILKKIELSKTQKKEISFDMLVMYREDIPKARAEVFGTKTKVLPYSREPNARLSMHIKHLKATCIPYRLRLVGKTVYTHEGLDALKNYDLSKSGKLHESMKYMRKYLKIQGRGL